MKYTEKHYDVIKYLAWSEKCENKDNKNSCKDENYEPPSTTIKNSYKKILMIKKKVFHNIKNKDHQYLLMHDIINGYYKQYLTTNDIPSFNLKYIELLLFWYLLLQFYINNYNFFV